MRAVALHARRAKDMDMKDIWVAKVEIATVVVFLRLNDVSRSDFIFYL